MARKSFCKVHQNMVADWLYIFNVYFEKIITQWFLDKQRKFEAMQLKIDSDILIGK